jgi:hypothetical protein
VERLPVIRKAALISIENDVPARPAEKPGFVSARTGPIPPAPLPAGKMKRSESEEPATLAQRTPVIYRAFAAREITPGETWKIYLEASAMNGDMKNIALLNGKFPALPSYEKQEALCRLPFPNQNTAAHFASSIYLASLIQDAAGHFNPTGGLSRGSKVPTGPKNRLRYSQKKTWGPSWSNWSFSVEGDKGRLFAHPRKSASAKSG